MNERNLRVARRDNMAPSDIGKILEIFFGGNSAVDAAVVFDETGETVDYHTILDPYDTKLAAAYCGILYESVRFRMRWLQDAALTSFAFYTDIHDVVTVPLSEGFFLTLITSPGAYGDSLMDTIDGACEALCSEIG